MEKAWTAAAFATLGCVDDKVCLLACQAFLPSLAQTYFGHPPPPAFFFLIFFSFFLFFSTFLSVSFWLVFVPEAHTDGSIQQIRKWCELRFATSMVGISVLQGQL